MKVFCVIIEEQLTTVVNSYEKAVDFIRECFLESVSVDIYDENQFDYDYRNMKPVQVNNTNGLLEIYDLGYIDISLVEVHVYEVESENEVSHAIG